MLVYSTLVACGNMNGSRRYEATYVKHPDEETKYYCWPNTLGMLSRFTYQGSTAVPCTETGEEGYVVCTSDEGGFTGYVLK